MKTITIKRLLALLLASLLLIYMISSLIHTIMYFPEEVYPAAIPGMILWCTAIGVLLFITGYSIITWTISILTDWYTS